MRLLCSPASLADVLHVPSEYATIQAAIDAAVDGDEIIVAPGTYGESLLIGDRSITIRSEDPGDRAVVAATIISPAWGLVARADTPWSSTLRVDGFTFFESNGFLLGPGEFELERCVFTGVTGTGSWINSYGTNLTVRSCENTAPIIPTSGTVIEAGGAVSVLIEECTIRDSVEDTGLVAEDADVEILNSTFENVRRAFDILSVFPSSNAISVRIEDCCFSGQSGPGSAVGQISGAAGWISNCLFEQYGTPAFDEGGAGLFVDQSEMSIIDSSFRDINSTDWYCALVFSNGVLTMERCAFEDNWGEEEGAAIRVSDSWMDIDSTSFRGNYTASPSSGGTSVFSNGDAMIGLSNCAFENNESRGIGGAITIAPNTVLAVTDSVFRNNIATRSSGVAGINSAAASFRRCTFERNRAGSEAGTIGSYGDSQVDVVECAFFENVGRYGGALYADRRGVVSAVGCTFDGNAAFRVAGNGEIFGFGGAAYAALLGTIDIAGSAFVGNSAAEGGGAVAVDVEGTVSLIGCAVISNVAPIGSAVSAGTDTTGGQVGSVSIANCILAGHPSATRFFDGSGTAISVGWSLAPGLLPGSSNVSGDPMLTTFPDDGGDGWSDDPGTSDIDEAANNDYGDLRLLPGSPAIDAGDSSLLPVDTFDIDDDGDTNEPLPLDLDGNPRVTDDPATPDTGPVSPTVDLGAYEFQPAACIADLTDDGVLNFDDIDVFVAGFLGGDLVADLDSNGVLNFDDIDAFVDSFLAGCP